MQASKHILNNCLEYNIISRIAEQLPRSQNQLNGLFESDSEIIKQSFSNLLFTVDEFSAEDNFREHDPYNLGWNLTVATISDIYASGGLPRFFAHSLVLEKEKWNDHYLTSFSKGIADVLKKTNCFFMGGDTGYSNTWHYTGIALGETDKPIKRKGANSGDFILMTGEVGAGNLEAALNIYSKNKILNQVLKLHKTFLIPRHDESQLAKEYATSCIDSSDGVMNAITTIADLNGLGYQITNVPYNQTGVKACKLLSKPKELLLLGEAGEYELIFTVSAEKLDEFLIQAKDRNLKFSILGQMKDNSVKILQTDSQYVDFMNYNIRVRDYENTGDYLSTLTDYIKSHGNNRSNND